MSVNEGGIDRTLRIVVGLGVLSLFFVLDGPARWWGIAGLLPLLTGLIGFCPMYTVFGINTCPMNRQG